MHDADGKIVRSVEMTSIKGEITRAQNLSPALNHGIEKAAERHRFGKPIPGKLESVAEISLPERSLLGDSGHLEISHNGDVVQVTKGVPPKMIPKGNIFENFAKRATALGDTNVLDVVTIVDKETGAVLARLERKGSVWGRTK